MIDIGLPPKDRSSTLKSAERLSGIYGNYVVYDRDGYLGFRLMVPGHGPSEAGVEIDYFRPQKLNPRETPMNCYYRTVRSGLPDRAKYLKLGPEEETCRQERPQWLVGSLRDFQGDLLAILRAAADRFQAPLFDTAFMMFALSSCNGEKPQLCVEPDEFILAHTTGGMTKEIRDWLVEDFMRLETALFRRNFPLGCKAHNYTNRVDHYHEPVRFSVWTHLNGSGHEMLELADRYLAIEAAAREDFQS